MLLFNSERTAGVGDRPQFKNISCYCLTVHYSTDQRRIENLKTSHVIV